MRIAYLVNQYPAISHSFIRREILALESLGSTVTRITIRPSAKYLPDQQDKAEQGITACILGQGIAALLWAVLQSTALRPLKAAQAVGAALKMAGWDPRRIFRHLAYFAEAAWLAKHLRKERVDHLHAHFGTNPAAVARIASHFSGIPFSFTAHGPTEFDSPQALDLRGKVADAHAAIAISSYGRSQLMRWSQPRHWPKIKVVRCGLDESFLDAPAAPPEDEPRLCFIGRLTAQKGLPLLIDACGLLKARGIRFELVIVGDGELRAELHSRVAILGLDEEVAFAGACDAPGVRVHMMKARALVLPSFAEGLPVVLTEALALGRPVIATRIAGIPELVDQQCGWLIPAGSVEALAGAMQEALGTALSRLGEMGAMGRERVAAMHDAKANAAQLLELIDTRRSPVAL